MSISSKSRKSDKIPLIIDTDMSPDSWTAILFAALNPNADLLAVSVSGTGEAHGPRGARNAQRLLELAGKSDIPVSYGPPKPLRGDEHFPNLMRFVVDRMLWQKLPIARRSSLPVHDSIQLISNILRKSQKKVTIAAVGPQTNLATLLTKYPELKSKIKGIYIMGGALDAPGNIQGLSPKSDNTTAEWNFYCDPLAVKVVIDSGVPVYLVPLDATNQVPVTQNFKDRFSSISQPAGKFVCSVINLLTARLGQKEKFYLWDPVTTACALDASLAKFAKRKVGMVTEAGSEWGRIKYAMDGSSINVAVKVDPIKFEDTLINSLA